MNKILILTGAAGGIGRATWNLLKTNTEYLFCLIDQPKSLVQFKKDYAEDARKFDLFPCDLSDKKQIKKAVRDILGKHKRIDILINNAGVMRPSPFQDTSEKEIEEQIQINLLGSIFMTRECLSPLLLTKGKIINMASLAGVIPAPNHSIYSASKFALRSFTLSLRMELASSGISVVCILPGTIDTPMTSHMASKVSSPMAYLNPPISAEYVAKAVEKAIRKDLPEIYVPYSQGLLARIGLFFPSLLVKIFPILAKMGNANLKKWKNEGIL